VLVFATAVTFAAGVMSGFLPALKTASVKDLMPLIQEGTQRSGSGNASRRMLGSLVVAEIAIAVALLTGGALMIESFQCLQHVELGFRPDGLLTMHMELSPNKYREFPKRRAFAQRMLEGIQRLPGVVSAGITTNLPLTAFIARDSVFAVQGR